MPQTPNSQPLSLKGISRREHKPVELYLPRQAKAFLNGFGGGGWGGNGNGEYHQYEKLNISKITWREVSDAYRFFRDQLEVGTDSRRIIKNSFCIFKLSPQEDKRPPEMFGRVWELYPGEGGTIGKIEHLEILLPRYGQPPALITLKGSEIAGNALDRPPESYNFKVQILASPSEASSFEGFEDDFRNRGFEPKIDVRYDKLQRLSIMKDVERKKMPWAYIVCSEWLSRLPPNIYAVVISNLRALLMQNRVIINYDPDKNMKFSLRKIFDLRPRSRYLLEEIDEVDEAVEAVEDNFSTMFNHSMKDLIM